MHLIRLHNEIKLTIKYCQNIKYHKINVIAKYVDIFSYVQLRYVIYVEEHKI